MKTEVTIVFGERLRNLIEEKKYGREEVAKMTGIAREDISKYIAGLQRPTEEKLFSLINALGTSSDYLLGLTEKSARRYKLERYATFGERLSEVVEASKFNKNDFAKQIDISYNALFRYMKEERKPKIETVLAIAEFTSLSTDYLYGFSKKQKQ